MKERRSSDTRMFASTTRRIAGPVEVEEISKLIFGQPTLFQLSLDCRIEPCQCCLPFFLTRARGRDIETNGLPMLFHGEYFIA
jgi:hypothetical protein